MIGIVLNVFGGYSLLRTAARATTVAAQPDPARSLGAVMSAVLVAALGVVLLRAGRRARRDATARAEWCGTRAANGVGRMAVAPIRRPRRASIFGDGRLLVDVERTAEGEIRFNGQDLESPFGDPDDGPTEYEYSLAVGAADVETLRQPLGAGDGDDLIDLLVRNGAAIVQQGEQRWLRSLGIEPELWSRVGA